MLIEELRAARRSAGWSRPTLASRLGVDVQTIKRLEAGIGAVATLTAAMAALDFSLAGLAPGKTLEEKLRNRRRALRFRWTRRPRARRCRAERSAR